jgi:hypothetical protein
MHYLHRILVHIPDITSDSSESTRPALIRAIRNYAEEETSDAYGSVFDWRETETAGRWSETYPVNVLIAQDDIEAFVVELYRVREQQEGELLFCVSQLETTVGTDIKHICNQLWSTDDPTDGSENAPVLTAYYCFNRVQWDYSLRCLYHSTAEISFQRKYKKPVTL